MNEKVRRVMVSAIVTVLSIGTGMGVQRTVLPLYTSGFVQHTYTYLFVVLLPILSFGMFKGIADLLAGYLADRLGRKVAVVIGASIFLIGISVLISSKDVLTIVLSTLLMGWSQGLIDSGVMIILSDIGGRERHGLSLGIMESSVYGGYTIGSVLGGYVSRLRNIPTAFYITLMASVLAFILSLAGISETREKVEEGVEMEEIPTTQAYSMCLRSATLRLTYLLGHVAQLSDALVWGLLPLYLLTLGFDEFQIGLVQGLNTLTWAVLMPFSGRISDVFGRRVLIFLGLSTKALAIYLLHYFTRPFQLSILSVMMGLGVGLYYPILPAISADAAPPVVRGRSMGLYTSFRDFGYMTGALSLGVIGEFYGYDGVFTITAFLLTVGALVIFLMKETRPFWPAFDVVLKHTEMVISSVHSFTTMVRSYSRGKRDEEVFQKVKEYENEADDLRLVIDRQLWLSSLSGHDKADFARLVGRIDRIASFALGASRRLHTLDPENIPIELRELMEEMADVSIWISNRLYKAVISIRDDVETSLKLVSEIDSLESIFDELHQKAMEKLVEAQDRIDIVSLMNLRDFIELFENMIDAVEDASDVLRVIAFKHMAWPV
ncbi:MAG: MFS transporter [Candidatus Korarchaeota archaeon]|nr:MFS transporter [Candidatus Korarchaeota archaeon]